MGTTNSRKARRLNLVDRRAVRAGKSRQNAYLRVPDGLVGLVAKLAKMRLTVLGSLVDDLDDYSGLSKMLPIDIPHAEYIRRVLAALAVLPAGSARRLARIV